MEDSWENWFSHLEMDGGGSSNQCQSNSSFTIEELRRSILQLPVPTISSETESQSQSHHFLYPSSGVQSKSSTAVDGGAGAATAAVSSSYFEEMGFKGQCSDSWNNAASAMLPEQDNHSSLKPSGDQQLGHCSSHLASKRAQGNREDLEPMANQGTKKGRSFCQSLDHIMSERKRRQEMAERFVALSATIPGLKKIDKASVLRESINYVKLLQERIAMLEKETKKKRIKSLIMKKSNLCSASFETNSSDFYGSNEVLPEVEARSLEKEVLIRIYCEKRKGIMLKLMALLENIHLSMSSSSILPFGNSILNVIIIIARMGEEYHLTVNDLVKSLKQDLLKFYDIQL